MLCGFESNVFVAISISQLELKAVTVGLDYAAIGLCNFFSTVDQQSAAREVHGPGPGPPDAFDQI